MEGPCFLTSPTSPPHALSLDDIRMRESARTPAGGLSLGRMGLLFSPMYLPIPSMKEGKHVGAPGSLQGRDQVVATFPPP
jgi:hypothetical protein